MALSSRLDSWVNALTGLGGVRDKVQAYLFQRRGRTNDDELEAMYEEDDVAAKVCDLVPEHMLRRGFKVVIPDDPDMAKAVNDKLDSLEIVRCLTDALVWERVFGGGVCVLGLDDGQDVGLPLDEDQLRDVLFINVLDRRDVIPIYWYSNPNAPDYGKPEVYRVTYYMNGIKRPEAGAPPQPSMTMEVHESRLLIFGGMRSTTRTKLRNHSWGMPFLSKLRVPLRGFHSNWQSVEHMMTDASQGVYKMKGLLSAISSGNKEALHTRMELVEMSKSVARAIIVDADSESYERKDTSMSGLPDLLDRSATRLAMGARAPVTILMGVSPAGLNATGEGDTRGWYDTLEAEREQKVTPRIKVFVRLVMVALDGPTGGFVPENWDIEYPPLWQPTDAEKATTFSTVAGAIGLLVSGGLITPEEGVMQLAKYLEGIDLDSREKAIEEYEAALKTGVGNLPTVPVPGGPPPKPGAPPAPQLPPPPEAP